MIWLFTRGVRGALSRVTRSSCRPRALFDLCALHFSFRPATVVEMNTQPPPSSGGLLAASYAEHQQLDHAEETRPRQVARILEQLNPLNKLCRKPPASLSGAASSSSAVLRPHGAALSVAADRARRPSPRSPRLGGGSRSAGGHEITEGGTSASGGGGDAGGGVDVRRLLFPEVVVKTGPGAFHWVDAVAAATNPHHRHHRDVPPSHIMAQLTGLHGGDPADMAAMVDDAGVGDDEDALHMQRVLAEQQNRYRSRKVRKSLFDGLLQGERRVKHARSGGTSFLNSQYEASRSKSCLPEIGGPMPRSATAIDWTSGPVVGGRASAPPSGKGDVVPRTTTVKFGAMLPPLESDGGEPLLAGQLPALADDDAEDDGLVAEGPLRRALSHDASLRRGKSSFFMTQGMETTTATAARQQISRSDGGISALQRPPPLAAIADVRDPPGGGDVTDDSVETPPGLGIGGRDVSITPSSPFRGSADSPMVSNADMMRIVQRFRDSNPRTLLGRAYDPQQDGEGDTPADALLAAVKNSGPRPNVVRRGRMPLGASLTGRDAGAGGLWSGLSGPLAAKLVTHGDFRTDMLASLDQFLEKSLTSLDRRHQERGRRFARKYDAFSLGGGRRSPTSADPLPGADPVRQSPSSSSMGSGTLPAISSAPPRPAARAHLRFYATPAAILRHVEHVVSRDQNGDSNRGERFDRELQWLDDLKLYSKMNYRHPLAKRVIASACTCYASDRLTATSPAPDGDDYRHFVLGEVQPDEFLFTEVVSVCLHLAPLFGVSRADAVAMIRTKASRFIDDRGASELQPTLDSITLLALSPNNVALGTAGHTEKGGGNAARRGPNVAATSAPAAAAAIISSVAKHAV